MQHEGGGACSCQPARRAYRRHATTSIRRPLPPAHWTNTLRPAPTPPHPPHPQAIERNERGRKVFVRGRARDALPQYFRLIRPATGYAANDIDYDTYRKYDKVRGGLRKGGAAQIGRLGCGVLLWHWHGIDYGTYRKYDKMRRQGGDV